MYVAVSVGLLGSYYAKTNLFEDIQKNGESEDTSSSSQQPQYKSHTTTQYPCEKRKEFLRKDKNVSQNHISSSHYEPNATTQ